ncbi:MAG: histidine kinase [Actinomycetia bacterium]|nr:histidine kinase [Actinomycetes bacterium]
MGHHQPYFGAGVPSSQHHAGADQAISQAARGRSSTRPSKWQETRSALLSPTISLTALSGSFLLQFIAVLGASPSSHPTKLAGSLACSAAVFALQVRNSSPRAVSWSARCRIAIITAEAIGTYLPALAFSVIWPGMAGFLADSVLLLMQARKGWIVFMAVVMSTVAAAIPLRLGAYSAALDTVASLATGLAAFGLFRLAAIVRQAYAVQAELVQLAAIRDRARFTRDLHGLLGRHRPGDRPARGGDQDTPAQHRTKLLHILRAGPATSLRWTRLTTECRGPRRLTASAVAWRTWRNGWKQTRAR